jgi:hypothetical protein
VSYTPSFSHYRWLDQHLPKFLEDAGVSGGWSNNAGIVSAHGDKFYQYKDEFEKANLSFVHGCAIGMLTHCHPYSAECRSTDKGWVPPVEWIIQNKDRFLHLLPLVDENNPGYFW